MVSRIMVPVLEATAAFSAAQSRLDTKPDLPSKFRFSTLLPDQGGGRHHCDAPLHQFTCHDAVGDCQLSRCKRFQTIVDRRADGILEEACYRLHPITRK